MMTRVLFRKYCWGLVLLPLLLLNSCELSPKKSQPTEKIGLEIINSYVTGIEDWDGNHLDWLLQHSNTSPNFKTALQDIIHKARLENPEFGLDFDPVLDGQDYPDKGFILKDYDATTGYMTLSGIEWPEFILVIRVIQHDNIWYLDGSGVVNIPESKRAEHF